MTGRHDLPDVAAFPPRARKMLLPWWEQRLALLVAAFEAALASEEGRVEVDGVSRTTDWLTAETLKAEAIVERLRVAAREDMRGPAA